MCVHVQQEDGVSDLCLRVWNYICNLGVMCREVLPRVMKRVVKEEGVLNQWMHCIQAWWVEEEIKQ